MSGIISVVSTKPVDEMLYARGEKCQFHRGPDAQGYGQYQTSKWHITLGHQSLRTHNLSEHDSQSSFFENRESGVIINNGEIYNYKQLGEELEREGLKLNKKTEVEVMLTALLHWGVDRALNKFNGTWALVWFDKAKNRIIVARDRLGIKPVHILAESDRIIIASEMKTVLELAERKFSLNLQVVGEYLLQSLLEASNYTFFAEIEKLPPGHYGVIDLSQTSLNIQLKQYWELEQIECDSGASEDDLSEEMRDLFFDAVNMRSRSDVPIGVLLSGGVDSSSIASVMHHVLGRDKIMLLSAVSDNPQYDESPFIDKMGAYLDMPISKVNVKFEPDEAISYLEEVSWYNDEPVGSFSNIAHFLLMKKAKELGLTVIMSGQGADELLCGYRKYFGFYVQELVRSKKYSQALRIIYSFWKQGTILHQFNFADAKRYLPDLMNRGQLDMRGERLLDYTPHQLGLQKGMTVNERQFLDVRKYSVPALVHYEDRMSMAWSREVRVPFLDHRLVEKFLQVPTHFKLKNGWTKYIFRKAMEPYVIDDIIWRKDKQGFINPQSQWIKFELRSEIHDILSDDCLIYKLKLVNKDNVLKIYDAYCKQAEGQGKYSYKDIFNPLALEIWLRKFERYIAL